MTDIVFERDNRIWQVICLPIRVIDPSVPVPIVARGATAADLLAAGFVPRAELDRLAERFEALQELALELREDGASHWRLKANVALNHASAPTEGKDSPVGERCAACGAVWSNDRQIDMLSDAVEPYRLRATQAESRVSQLDASLTDLASFLSEHDGTPSADPCAEAIRIMQIQAASATEANRRIADMLAQLQASKWRIEEHKASEATWRTDNRAHLESIRVLSEKLWAAGKQIGEAEGRQLLAEARVSELEMANADLANSLSEESAAASKFMRSNDALLERCEEWRESERAYHARVVELETELQGCVTVDAAHAEMDELAEQLKAAQLELNEHKTFSNRIRESWSRLPPSAHVALNMLDCATAPRAPESNEAKAGEGKPTDQPEAEEDENHPCGIKLTEMRRCMRTKGHAGPCLDDRSQGWRWALAWPGYVRPKPATIQTSPFPEVAQRSACTCFVPWGASLHQHGWGCPMHPDRQQLKREPVTPAPPAEAPVSRAELVAALRRLGLTWRSLGELAGELEKGGVL